MGTLNRFNWEEIKQTGGYDKLVIAGGELSSQVVNAEVSIFDSIEIINIENEFLLPKSSEIERHVIYVSEEAPDDLLIAMSSIVPKLSSKDMVILTRAWYFLNEKFLAGVCPPNSSAFDKLPDLQALLESVSDTHAVVRSVADDGYVLVLPHELRSAAEGWFYLLPMDPNPKKLQLRANVPGVTSISLLRRVHDARFATRYFRGYGIDVGGGNDSLALYLEFFPLIKNLVVYEQEQGDGQYLHNVKKDSFDFLFSSHCLEHLVNPQTALSNWLRVVKPGGHLVFQIPDEDMYEQGVWPSRFNTDHKHTFTIAKSKSWSPVSINVMDLLFNVRDSAKVISVSQIDHGVRSRLLNKGIDQTRFPMAECGIEVILQKLEY